MQRPTTINDIQKRNGKIISLGRFLSKLASKFLSFLKMLRGAISKTTPQSRKLIEWTEDCDRAFKELKEYLKIPLILSRPAEAEVLDLYIAVKNKAISSVLV